MMVAQHDEILNGLNVSRETIDRLNDFLLLLEKWNKAVNLVSKATLNHAWSRHILDSAQIFMYGGLAKHWVDIGSGGGLPGLVVAVLATEKAPLMCFTLVESDQRKAEFLREASRALSLSTNILADRAETVPKLGADIVSARALAPLGDLCALAKRHMSKDGRAIFLKGKSCQAEILDARKNWKFDLEAHSSKTDPASFVLVLNGIEHV